MTALVLGLLAFGLIQVFFGYRLFRVLVGVIGGLIGYYYAPAIITLGTGVVPGTATSIVIGVGLALVFALLAWYVFRLAAFVWGATMGYAVSVVTFAAPWLALVIGLVVGALAMLFQRAVIVLLTALNGAWLVVSGTAYLFGQITTPPRGLVFDPLLDLHGPASAWLIGLTLVLAAVGACYQFWDTAPMLGRRGGRTNPPTD
jgi:hypothetical protein